MPAGFAKEKIFNSIMATPLEKSPPPVDWGQVMDLFDCLGKDPAETFLRVIKPPRGPCHKFRLDPSKAEGYVSDGWALYYNVGNGGTCKADITSLPGFFAEWDDRPKSVQITLWRELGLPHPSIQIDTAGKSIHTYWVLDQPIRPDQWESIQARLLDYADAYRAVKDCSRVMRLPGVLRRDAEGHLNRTSIITINSNRYRPEDIEACLPPVPPPPKPRLPYRPRGRKQPQLDRVLDALSHIPRRVKGGGTYSEMRNVAWALRACLEECGQADPEAAAIQLLEAHSPSRECGWDVAQVVRSGGQQIGPGTLFHHAKQHGYKPKRHG